jgi:hypothetical protein
MNQVADTDMTADSVLNVLEYFLGACASPETNDSTTYPVGSNLYILDNSDMICHVVINQQRRAIRHAA